MMSATEETSTSTLPEQQKQDEFIKKLEDDDEFEDFPADDWEESQTDDIAHEANLWEESWEDHDDYKDHFIQRLRYV